MSEMTVTYVEDEAGQHPIGGLRMDRKPHILMIVLGITPFKPNSLACFVTSHFRFLLP